MRGRKGTKRFLVDGESKRNGTKSTKSSARQIAWAKRFWSGRMLAGTPWEEANNDVRRQ